jgi:hypothetical protein
MRELTSTFNSVLSGKMLLVANELCSTKTYKSAEKLMNELKTIITDGRMRIGRKYMEVVTENNNLNVIFLTNSSSPLNLSAADRRFFIRRVSTRFFSDKTFFNALVSSLDDNFYEQLLTFYLSRDIKGFDPTIIPMTEEKRVLTLATMDPIDHWCLRYIRELTHKNGIRCSEARDLRPAEFKSIHEFQLALQDRCERKQVRDGTEVYGVYTLLPAYSNVLQRLKQL